MPISKPDVNISLSSATSVLDIGTRRDLIVCQMPSADDLLHTGLHSMTQSELDALLTAGSYARVMVQQWLDANRTGNNVGAELDFIALKENAAAVACVNTITFAGTATAAGNIEVSILSSKLYKKNVSVAVGDANTAVSLAIKSAFGGTTAPFAVTDSTGVVSITATDKGAIGAGYGVEITGVPAGLTATVAVDTTDTAIPGSITDIMDVVGNRRYQGILWPAFLASAVSEVVDFLDDRFNVSNDILDGVAFMGLTNTLANLKVSANAENSQSLVMAGNAVTVGNSEKLGPEIVHPVDWTMATFMGIRARRLTDNASITSVLATTAFNDQYGGRSLASLPYFNTPLSSVPVTDAIALFDGTEQAELNEAGFGVIGPNRPVTEVITGSIPTSYKTDIAGNEDVSFKYLNYVDTASVCREFLFNNFKAKFIQSRLTDGDLLPGRSMENAASLKSAFKGFIAILQDDALIRQGRTAEKIIDANLSVTIDLAGRKATIASVLPIVTQLETINMPLQLTFEQ